MSVARTLGVCILCVCIVPARAQDLYILAVGIDRKEKNRDKDDAAKDAKQFATMMQRHAAPEYKEVKVFRLVGEKANYTKIIGCMRTIGPKLKENDLVVVFVSCHGGGNEQGHYSIWTLEKGVTGHDFVDFMESTRGKVILILDTCHAGSAVKDFINLHCTNKHVCIFAACRPDEESSGRGGHERKPENGIFTSIVFKGLQGEAGHGNGKITVSDLHQYLNKHAELRGQHAMCKVEPGMASVPLTRKTATRPGR